VKMNFNKNTFNLTRKQGIAIAVILATGIVAGTWILGGSTSQPAGEQHEHASHAEAKGHADAEHHGSKAGDGHEHAKEHGDAEHHEDEPQSGPHGGKLLPRMVLVWNCCCPKMVVSQVSVSGCSRKESRLHQLQQKSR